MLPRFLRHPIFPLFCLIPLTQILRDEYPISHYPMYSQPDMDALHFVYVAGADGKPLPMKWHTGITPSQVGKKYGRHKILLVQKEEKRLGKKLDHPDATQEASFKASAGRETLAFLRDLSLDRAQDRHLKQPLRLMEVEVDFIDGKIKETQEIIAELAAAP